MLFSRSGYDIGSCGAGGRFSKSPQEREQMLAQRKHALLSQARRRFVTRPRVGTCTDEIELLPDGECVTNP